MPTSRRLVAIMFADIVGYTAMMQRDEQKSLKIVQQFKHVLKAQVEKYNGETLELRGDGALVIFHSAVEAIHTAKKIQIELRQNPKVPLRIGIHIGDIVFAEDNIYGDGVNLASRVESMGVPGSVLVTERVMHDIKNQPEFEMKALGQFQFKNVEQPIFVFALANEGFTVPKASEISGKGKRLKTWEPALQSWIKFGLMGFLGMFVGGVLWLNYAYQNPDISKEVLQERIAVLPFENNTNDTTLNILGNMTADWITQHLINFTDIKVVQFENSKTHLDLINLSPDEFVKRTGAKHMINGRFYLERDKLIFQSNISNPITKEIKTVLPTVSGNKGTPSKIVDELSQRISGHFVASDDVFSATSNFQAPIYEAFQAYQEGTKYFGGTGDYKKARYYYSKAIEIDSNFLIPHFMYALSYLNSGNVQIADSLHQELSIRFSKSPKTEKQLLNLLGAFINHNREEELRIVKERFEIDPKNFIDNYQYGFTALGMNMPQTTIEVFQHLDPKQFKFDIPFKRYWFHHYAYAYLQTAAFDKALEIINHVPKSINPAYGIRALIFTYKNEADSLMHLIKTMEIDGVSEELILSNFNLITSHFKRNGDTLNYKKWSAKSLERISIAPQNINIDSNQIANTYFITENFSKALLLYGELAKSRGATDQTLMRLGYIHARLNNPEKAEAYIQSIGANETEFSLGGNKYNQALIYAGLEEKAIATQLLKQAYKEGYDFGASRYDYTIELTPLRGFPPYEEFVRPR